LHNPDPGPARAQAGEADPDLFFTDRPRAGARGQRNREYVSLFADDAPRALSGRSPLECYGDLMRAFRDAFQAELGGLVEEVVVGAGPCGELRFPSYPEANGWRFPGVRRAARGPAAPRAEWRSNRQIGACCAHFAPRSRAASVRVERHTLWQRRG